MSARNVAVLLLCGLPLMGHADVILKGKTTSRISGHVIQSNNLFVTDESGGWYEQGLTLQQPGGFHTPYEVEVPLRITSSSGIFQVHMDDPLVLQNEARPELQFRDVAVKMARQGEPLQALAVSTNITFHNPPAATEGEDSIGHYLLNISGLPPAGEFKAVTGTYNGVLSLTFEPVIEE